MFQPYEGMRIFNGFTTYVIKHIVWNLVDQSFLATCVVVEEWHDTNFMGMEHISEMTTKAGWGMLGKPIELEWPYDS